MTQNDPSRRPSAEFALWQWRTIRGRMNFLRRFGRLRHRNESLLSIPLLNIFYALGSIPLFARLLSRGILGGMRRILTSIYS